MSHISTIEAAPAKLRDGQWGCRGRYADGGSRLPKFHTFEFKVTARSGKSWMRDYTVIWVGDDGSFLAAPPRKQARSTRRRSECSECGEWISSRTQRCWETGGYCVDNGEY